MEKNYDGVEETELLVTGSTSVLRMRITEPIMVLWSKIQTPKETENKWY